MIADYLYIACESEYYTKPDWQDWADGCKQLEQLELYSHE